MKVKAIANFMMNDSKRGTMVEKRKGEEFEMDEIKDAEQLYELIMMGRITVTDKAFVPDRAEYVALHETSYVNEDGLPRRISFNGKTKLPREIAVKLMVSGHVKPADETAWTPRKLLAPTVAGSPPRRMFDDLPKEKGESWITKGVVR